MTEADADRLRLLSDRGFSPFQGFGDLDGQPSAPSESSACVPNSTSQMSLVWFKNSLPGPGLGKCCDAPEKGAMCCTVWAVFI
jgi:hypothetical protein